MFKGLTPLNRSRKVLFYHICIYILRACLRQEPLFCVTRMWKRHADRNSLCCRRVSLSSIFTATLAFLVFMNVSLYYGPFTINVRAEVLSGWGSWDTQKRPDINYFSKSAEKLRTDIVFAGEVVVTTFTSWRSFSRETLRSLSRANAPFLLALWSCLARVRHQLSVELTTLVCMNASLQISVLMCCT